MNDKITSDVQSLSKCVLFHGFTTSGEMFCSFSTYYNSSFINYKAHNKFLIYSFLYNKFYITTAPSTCYKQFLADYLINTPDVKRTTTSINGRDVSLFNDRKVKCYNILLDRHMVEREFNIPADLEIPTVESFAVVLFKKILKRNYNERLIKEDVIKLYSSFVNDYILGVDDGSLTVSKPEDIDNKCDTVVIYDDSEWF